MGLRDIVPTDKEIVMREEDFIVSKTDLKGRITYGKFTNKDGAEVNTCDIIAEQMQMLGKREGGGQSAPQKPANRTADRSQPHKGGSGFDDMDDAPF